MLVLLFTLPALWAFQPDPPALRAVYEQALASRVRLYGLSDARTAQAARDLGRFLRQWGNDPAASQQALAQAIAIDQRPSVKIIHRLWPTPPN